jgi:cysteine desulfurase
LDPCKYLETLGFEVTYLPVESDGLVNLSLLEKAIRKDTILVSIMAANNEIGVLQPLLEIGEICHQKGVLCHTDGAQGIGKIPLNVITQNIDLMSLTAHKIHGPKGIGALYIRRKNPRVKMAPQLHGGGQERGWRSGTLATPSIVGFGKALEIAIEDRDLEYQIILEMRDYLWKQLSQIDGIYLNGHPTQRLASNLNISVEGVNGTALLLAIQPTVALSSGSACSSTKVAPSHVIKALGRNDKLAMATLRFGISRFNTMEEMDKVVRVVKEAITNLRQKV